MSDRPLRPLPAKPTADTTAVGPRQACPTTVLTSRGHPTHPPDTSQESPPTMNTGQINTLRAISAQISTLSAQISSLSAKITAVKDELNEEFASLDEADQDANQELEDQANELDSAADYLDQAESLIDDLLPDPTKP